jgi:hypothetical protein
MKFFLLILICSLTVFGQRNLFPEDSLVSPWHLVSSSNKLTTASLPYSNLLSGAVSSVSAIYAQNGKTMTINVCDFGTNSAAEDKLSIVFNVVHPDLFYPDTTCISIYSGSAMLFKRFDKYFITINTDSLLSTIEQARQMELIIIDELKSLPIRYSPARNYNSKTKIISNKVYYTINGKVLNYNRPVHKMIIKNSVVIIFSN